jgi:hypothetical protein
VDIFRTTAGNSRLLGDLPHEFAINAPKRLFNESRRYGERLLLQWNVGIEKEWERVLKMKVLLATDGSDCSRAAIKKYCEMFGSETAELRLITVVGMRLPETEPWVSSPDYFREINMETHKHAGKLLVEAAAELRNQFPRLAANL